MDEETKKMDEEKKEVVVAVEDQEAPIVEIKKEEKEEDVVKEKRGRRDFEVDLNAWTPKTKAGLLVKQKKLNDLDEVLKEYKILESEIVDSLIKTETDLLNIGQSKGKFGGGKRRVWKQTQKKTCEGNVATFACLAVAGDRNGHVGLGYGKAKETLPGREKAFRDSKLNIMKINRGCGSFDCSCNEPHSIPFKVKGKCGSTTVILSPAPQGTGLAVGDECKKILRLAGIKDIYGQTFGQTRTTINLAKACMDALKKTNIK